MCLSLRQETVLKIQSQCQDIHTKCQVIVHELINLLGLLASTIFLPQVVLPTQMNFRYLKQQQIKALRSTQSYEATVFLNRETPVVKLQWWIQNLQICNRS